MADYRNTLFIEHSALESILTDYWKARVNIDISNEKLTAYTQWYDCITRHAELVLDFDQENFIELAKSNPFYMALLKFRNSGGSKLVFWSSFPVDIIDGNRASDFQNSLFIFDCSADQINKYIKDYGLMFVNHENFIMISDQIFYPLSIEVKRNQKDNELKSWKDLNKIRHPFNSMIITDNYILKEEEDIRLNLIPLLDGLLPEDLSSCAMQLVIVTQEMEETLLEKRYKMLHDAIKSELKRPYNVDLSIVTQRLGKHHDRHIFTNYFRFKSGSSLSYFNKSGNSKVDTYLDGHSSFMIISGQQLMLEKNMKKLKQINRLLLHDQPAQIKGNQNLKENRLLMMVPID
jgi:hypothetical protein